MMSKINIQTLILKSCCWKNSSDGIPRQRLATNLQSAKNAASAECSEARVCTQTGSPGLRTRGLREGVQGRPSAQSRGSLHTRPFCPRVWLSAQVSLSTSHCGAWRGLKVETQSDSTLVHVFRHLPGHQCRLPTPLCGYGSSPWVLESLYLFHKLENFLGAGQAAQGPGLPALSWGSLVWWLPLRLLLSLRLELLLPPLNLYQSISSSPVTFKTGLQVSVLTACARWDLESEVESPLGPALTCNALPRPARPLSSPALWPVSLQQELRRPDQASLWVPSAHRPPGRL